MTWMPDVDASHEDTSWMDADVCPTPGSSKHARRGDKQHAKNQRKRSKPQRKLKQENVTTMPPTTPVANPIPSTPTAAETDADAAETNVTVAHVDDSDESLADLLFKRIEINTTPIFNGALPSSTAVSTKLVSHLSTLDGQTDLTSARPRGEPLRGKQQPPPPPPRTIFAKRKLPKFQGSMLRVETDVLLAEMLDRLVVGVTQNSRDLLPSATSNQHTTSSSSSMRIIWLFRCAAKTLIGPFVTSGCARWTARGGGALSSSVLSSGLRLPVQCNIRLVDGYDQCFQVPENVWRSVFEHAPSHAHERHRTLTSDQVECLMSLTQRHGACFDRHSLRSTLSSSTKKLITAPHTPAPPSPPQLPPAQLAPIRSAACAATASASIIVAPTAKEGGPSSSIVCVTSEEGTSSQTEPSHDVQMVEEEKNEATAAATHVIRQEEVSVVPPVVTSATVVDGPDDSISIPTPIEKSLTSNFEKALRAVFQPASTAHHNESESDVELWSQNLSAIATRMHFGISLTCL